MAGPEKLLRWGAVAGLAAVALLLVVLPWASHESEDGGPTELYWYYGKWIPDLSALSDPPQKVAATAPHHAKKPVAKAAQSENHQLRMHAASVEQAKSPAPVATSGHHQLPVHPAKAEKAVKPAGVKKESHAEPRTEPKQSSQPHHAVQTAAESSTAQHSAQSKASLKTDTPDGARQLKIDVTLRELKAQARKLGVNLGNAHAKAKSTLDEWGNVDMPVPTLEPGSATPELPFPPQSSPGSENSAVATQSLADYAIGKSVVLGPPEPSRKSSKMAAPAWSPYYLEPTRHPEVDAAAWKWAAALRQHRLAEREAHKKAAGESKQATAQSKDKDQKPAAKAEAAASVSELAQVGSAQAAPCPWYGCADGSHAWSAKAPPAPTSQLATQAPSVTAVSVADQILAKAKKAKKAKEEAKEEDKTQIAGAALFEQPEQLHLAHGFDTTNAYTADPITPERNQYYGGDHRFYGSERPVTSQGERSVSGKEAHANDMAPAYDIDEPSSFDSIPLASPSTFASRVAAHQPDGDGKLAEHQMRADVLGAWREYEHGLSQCMQAEATIDPSLKDFSCGDVQQGLGYLRDCMQNHQFGLDDMPLTRRQRLRSKVFQQWGYPAQHKQARLQHGAWGALPQLVELSYQLHPHDYKDVYSVLQQSAVFTTLWRMERLHSRCAYTGSAVKPDPSPRDQIRDIDSDL